MQKAKAKSALKAYNQMQNAVLVWVKIKASLLCMFLHELPKQFFRCCNWEKKLNNKAVNGNSH